MSASLKWGSELPDVTVRASRLLPVLLGLFLAGFVALISVDQVIDSLLVKLRGVEQNEQSRQFIGEELARTIKGMELDFTQMVASNNMGLQKQLQADIRKKAHKVHHDLLVLQNGGRVDRIIELNVEGVDNLNKQIVYQPTAADSSNLLELIEISPLLDKLQEKADELAKLLASREQTRESRNMAHLFRIEKELSLYFKHIPSMFIRLNENANRLLYESSIRISALDADLSVRRTTYKRIQICLVAVIVLLVMGIGSLLSRQLTAVNHQLLQSGKEMQEANEQAELANQFKSESLVLLEQEMAERQKADKALQALNVSLESRIAEEVRKNREKDGMLLHQEKLASIGQLAAGVAHEINNPMGFIMSNLTTLQGYVGSLQKYFQLVHENEDSAGNTQSNLCDARKKLDLDYILDDLQPLLAESVEGAERVRRIVLDLKDFARPDEQAMHDTDLNQLVKSTINIVRNELKYVAQLDLQLGELPRLLCHPQQINQVVSNLLVNAAHAIEYQGVITVRTWLENRFVVFAVTDTGKGIPPELISRIFDPFFTTKEVGKGTGLGLSISYDIIKKHNGEIAVESEVGKGTTFTVKLPVDATEERSDL